MDIYLRIIIIRIRVINIYSKWILNLISDKLQLF